MRLIAFVVCLENAGKAIYLRISAVVCSGVEFGPEYLEEYLLLSMGTSFMALLDVHLQTLLKLC